MGFGWRKRQTNIKLNNNKLMKKLFTIAVAVLATVMMTSCGGSKALKSDIDSLTYFMGANFGASVENFVNGIEGEVDLDLFFAGVQDQLKGKIKTDEKERNDFLRYYMQVVNPKKVLEESEKFLANVEKKSGVNKSESGLLYKVVREGDMEKVAVHDTDKVRVLYEGKLRNGKVFDSSYERGDTVTFTLNQVIKGWGEGLKYVGEGGEIQLWIPSKLAFGTWGSRDGSIGANQSLEFRVEVIEVIPTPEEELKRIEEQKKAKEEAAKAKEEAAKAKK